MSDDIFPASNLSVSSQPIFTSCFYFTASHLFLTCFMILSKAVTINISSNRHKSTRIKKCVFCRQRQRSQYLGDEAGGFLGHFVEQLCEKDAERRKWRTLEEMEVAPCRQQGAETFCLSCLHTNTSSTTC